MKSKCCKLFSAAFGMFFALQELRLCIFVNANTLKLTHSQSHNVCVSPCGCNCKLRGARRYMGRGRFPEEEAMWYMVNKHRITLCQQLREKHVKERVYVTMDIGDEISINSVVHYKKQIVTLASLTNKPRFLVGCDRVTRKETP
uniref:Gibberellin 20-oxidase n=1 Tax=Solanum tuberosum TaxID=4113 RepID=M1DCA5_SOLTU